MVVHHHRRRSALYVPASNERAVAKAQSLPCDVIILDLEDAVAPDAKAAARDRAAAAVRGGVFGNRELVVRVNGLETEWGAADIKALNEAGCASILAPKINSASDVAAYVERMRSGTALWLMIETARSLLRIEEIASSAPGILSALVLGTNDLASETGAGALHKGGSNLGALWFVVVAARAYGLSALDGVFNDISDAQGFAAQAKAAVDMGFDGKTLIHPGQIEPCNAAFTPTREEVEAAERILTVFDHPDNHSRGVVRIDGRMVERMHLAAAKRTLAKARDGLAVQIGQA